MFLLAPILFTVALVDEPEVPIDPPLPEGHVAFALKFETTGAAGLITPGDKVDVVLVEKDGESKRKASIVLRQALVVVTDTFEQKKKTIHSATLAVKPDDAKILAAAAKKGSFALMLRPPQPVGGIP